MQPDDFKSLEDQLRRSLMPVAMRQSATDSIHSMLDDLAGVEPVTAPAVAPVVRRAPWITAAAAAIALSATAAWWFIQPESPSAFTPTTMEENPADTGSAISGVMRLLGESTRLASVEDAGWHSDPDGGTHHAVRVQVVEEDRLLDEETGIIVHIASPREEMFLTPVSTF